MATILTDTYAPRWAGPALIERAKATRLVCEVHHAGAVQVPTSGTITLRDPANVSVLDAVAVTIDSSGRAVYDLLAASVPATYTPSPRWLLEWALTFADAQVHTFRRDAHLVLRRLYPVITQDDLTRRRGELTPGTRESIVPRQRSSLQGYLDEAWETLIERLVEDGRYPQQVMTPTSLKAAHKALTLHLVFDDMAAGDGEDRYSRSALWFWERYEEAWARLRYTVDLDEDNRPPSDAEEGSGNLPVVYLGGAPSTYVPR